MKIPMKIFRGDLHGLLALKTETNHGFDSNVNWLAMLVVLMLVVVDSLVE